MARIEWVKQRLENWALYVEREGSGGLGFARQSVLLSEPGGGYRESRIPVDEADGALTSQAVHALLPARVQLHQTLVHIYIMDTGVKGAAFRAGVSESAINARLEAADHALSAWFGARAEAQKKKDERHLST
jgi:hypothetical protein